MLYEVITELLRIESSISQIYPWQSMDVDVAQIEDTSTCRIMAGTVPVLEFPEYSKTIDEIEFAEHEKIYTDRDNVYVLLMYHNNGNVITSYSIHYTKLYDWFMPQPELENGPVFLTLKTKLWLKTICDLWDYLSRSFL